MEYIRTLSLLSLGIFLATGICAQENDSGSDSRWEHRVSLNFNFFQDAFYLLPTYEVNKGHLHFTARYNYEDINTFSGWVGYNFKGGDDLVYALTPMVGAVMGRTDAFAAGALIQLDFRKLSFYSESEYVFDVVAYGADYFANYLYTWTDISYALADWLSLGLSVQNLRLYQSQADIQRGLLVSANTMDIDITGYFYSSVSADPFFLLTLSKDF
jgi:hypothetical protein